MALAVGRAPQSAKELIDEARRVFGVSSLYAVAKHVGLPPRYVQRYYRADSMPRTSRALFAARIAA